MKQLEVALLTLMLGAAWVMASDDSHVHSLQKRSPMGDAFFVDTRRQPVRLGKRRQPVRLGKRRNDQGDVLVSGEKRRQPVRLGKRASHEWSDEESEEFQKRIPQIIKTDQDLHWEPTRRLLLGKRSFNMGSEKRAAFGYNRMRLGKRYSGLGKRLPFSMRLGK